MTKEEINKRKDWGWKTKYHGFKIGDKIRVKNPVLGHFGEKITNQIGEIYDFSPKVRIVRGENQDTLPYFAFVRFGEIDAGVNICNLEKVEKKI